MKSIFAAALIAALAFAQDPSYVEDATTEEPEPVPETPWYEYLFEQNESGNWQMIQPDLPQVEVNDVSQDELDAWVQGKMAEDEAFQAEWTSAWGSYQDAITQPWNDFVTNAEELTIRGHEADLATDKEVINYVVDNTFVDGASLRDMFPDVVDQIFTVMDLKADEFNTYFTLDDIRVPVALQAVEEYHEYEEEEEEPSKMEEIANAIGEKVVSYGFDPAVVEAWFEEKGTSWQELQQRQDEESAAQAQADIQEAADYAKNILDNWVTDLKAMRDDHQAEFEAQLDDKVTDLKAQVDAQSQENISYIENWINDTYYQVQDATSGPVPDMDDFMNEEEPVDEHWDEEFVVLAKKSKKSSGKKHHNKGSYMGAAGISAGVLATALYLYKKRQSKAEVGNQSLDEEFVMV